MNGDSCNLFDFELYTIIESCSMPGKLGQENYPEYIYWDQNIIFSKLLPFFLGCKKVIIIHNNMIF